MMKNEKSKTFDDNVVGLIKKSIAWTEINCFHSSYSSVRSISAIYIVCVDVLVCVQKNFFIGCSFFSRCMNIYTYTYIYRERCAYNHYFFLSSQHNALEMKKRTRGREKKESEDIERSIGRTTVLPEDTTGNKERGETGENEKEQLLLLLIWVYVHTANGWSLFLFSMLNIETSIQFHNTSDRILYNESGMRGRLLLWGFFIAFKTMRRSRRRRSHKKWRQELILSFSPHHLNGFTAFTNINWASVVSPSLFDSKHLMTTIVIGCSSVYWYMYVRN